MPKKNLAIIPARGGSKRLPKKNILPLNGKPLIQYTIDAVVNSGVFDTVILSSDSDEILDIGKSTPEVSIEKRDPSLAGDKVKVIDLVKTIAQRDGYDDTYDIIGLFLPTCPFRTAQHIKEGRALLSREDYSVVCVTEMDEPIQLALSMNENHIANCEAAMSPSPLVTGQTRSQDFNTLYRVTGGFYMAWLDKFITKDNFFQGQVKAYPTPKLNGIDIDDDLGLRWAEYLLQNNHLSV